MTPGGTFRFALNTSPLVSPPPPPPRDSNAGDRVTKFKRRRRSISIHEQLLYTNTRTNFSAGSNCVIMDASRLSAVVWTAFFFFFFFFFVVVFFISFLFCAFWLMIYYVRTCSCSLPSFLPSFALSLSLSPLSTLFTSIQSPLFLHLSVGSHSLTRSFCCWPDLARRAWRWRQSSTLRAPPQSRHCRLFSIRFDLCLVVVVVQCRAFRQMRISLSLTVQKY